MAHWTRWARMTCWTRWTRMTCWTRWTHWTHWTHWTRWTRWTRWTCRTREAARPECQAGVTPGKHCQHQKVELVGQEPPGPG